MPTTRQWIWVIANYNNHYSSTQEYRMPWRITYQNNKGEAITSMTATPSEKYWDQQFTVSFSGNNVPHDLKVEYEGETACQNFTSGVKHPGHSRNKLPLLLL